MAVSLGRLEVETADHVVLRYDLAGAGSRGFAALVDVVLALVVAFALTVVSVLALGAFPLERGAIVAGLSVFGVALFFFLYFVVLEWLWNGQTLGKRWAGLRVIAEDGRPAGFVAILIRNVVRLVDFLPAFYALGFVSIVVSPRSQRLGDLAAGTFVVRAPRPQLDWFSLRTLTRQTTPSGPAAHVSATGVTTYIDVRRLAGETQRLVREFTAREGRLSPADRARIAAPIAAHLRLRLGLDERDDLALIRAVASAMRASGDVER